MKDVAALHEKQSELQAVMQKLNDKETHLRKSKLDLQAAKQARDFVEQRVPQMEGQVLDLNAVVEKLTLEAEKE